MKLTKNKGIERKRTGGSSGKYQGPTRELLAATKTDSNCPRKGCAQWIIPRENDYVLAYINAKGVAKKVIYSIPQRGGHG